MRRTGVLVAVWAATTALAVVIGIFAVSRVGESLRDRGPVGADVLGGGVAASPTGDPSPRGPAVRERIEGEWGAFVVECRGTYAYGIEPRPDRAGGWKIDSWQEGPDDDVEAVFSNGSSSVSMQVFCNRGRPTLAELERDTLGGDED